MKRHLMLGTQLHAPDGFRHLLQGITYHFLIRIGVVRLIQFVEREPVRIGVAQRIDRPPPEVMLLEFEAEEFDRAIADGHIQVRPQQASLPPWCEGLSHSVEGAEDRRYGAKKVLHAERVEGVLRHFRPLIAGLTGLLSSPTLIKDINRFARGCRPEQNQKRFRAEFFAYILYNQNRNVIAYQTQNIGRWLREGHAGRKCGVKALGVGALHGFKSSDVDLIDDVRTAWQHWGRLGVTKKDIYRRLCAQIWRTISVKDQRGVKRLVRADGRPMLTYDQFDYRLEQLYGYAAIQERLHGRCYVREDLLPSMGRFSEAVANVGERSEADGYWVKEVVLGPDGQNALPALVVVRIIDVTSGMVLGIGFSLDGESAAAYRMAMFCSAIPKSMFGRLLGITIDDEAWPSVGLCDDTVTDRGAGGGNSAKANTEEGNPVISSMPPTGFGQGKASIESSHPRQIAMRDRPTHLITSLPLIELVRREVKDTVSLNDARDISDHLTPIQVKRLERITPLDFFNKLAEVGRNSMRPMTFEDAVRAFLTPVTLVAKPDGVYRGFQRYTSQELKTSGILHSVAASGKEIQLSGYMLNISIRYCFIEWHGRLMELSGVLALREDDEQLHVSLHELDALDAKLRVMKSDFRSHCDSTYVEAALDFEEQTGFDMDDSRLRMGPAKRRTAKGKEQATLVKSTLTPSRRAA
jgi:hypothetical protein